MVVRQSATLSLSSEHAEQCAVIEWAAWNKTRYPELAWLFAVPNGSKMPYLRNRQGQRFSPEALRMKREGLRPGVSDLVLPCARGIYHALFLELKYNKNKLTEEQAAFLAAMQSYGNLAVVCQGAEEAIALLQAYLDLPEGVALDWVAVCAQVHTTVTVVP